MKVNKIHNNPQKKKMQGTLQRHSTKLIITIPKLSSSSSSSSSLFFLTLFFHQFYQTKSHNFIYYGCSQEKYQPNSTPFETNLNTLLSSIVSSSSQSLYNSFAVGNDTSSSPEGSVFGLYQCRGDFQTKDCSNCIANLVTQIELICPYSYGSSMQLDGCFLRYEHIDFLGKLDTNLRFKKCSKGIISNDAEFLKRRDDVLSDLEASESGFRVSNSGSVEGYVQCVGDLNAGDCSSCISDAIMKVKSLCGSAAAADVFLAQCYVRYWASGYYDSSSDSPNNDDVGRTVAIIVGVLAGAAVVIVLLSVCRKTIAG
ncbi:hypothetical protein M9H77_33455 [Catharanthus roseus]|uniref:Uncharacterized protein n=1 Tax=Catharanthus roseus TaxID=4058 RepID=A0ACB9ZIS8_CATRO|nr:hypothetical protein M9H77_33455 [Catharanthus roseus]